MNNSNIEIFVYETSCRKKVNNMNLFKALVVKEVQGEVKYGVEKISISELSEGDVLIKVAYSSINYKDSLAVKSRGGVISNYPMIAGIDLSGIVVSSSTDKFKAGQHVLVTGFDVGMSHTGGFSEYARIPAKWVVSLPEGLSLKDSMIIGTAGFTAGLSILALERMGMSSKKNASILVTGATGGVGSLALQILKKSGYTNITALTRKYDQTKMLKNLGADNVVTLADIELDRPKALGSQKYHYVLDTVGGELLSTLIPQIYYGGSISICGNAGGIKFSTTVLPFILREIKLLGIDSVNYPIEKRDEIWNKFSQEWNIASNAFINIVTLEQLEEVFNSLQNGTHLGRTIVQIGE